LEARVGIEPTHKGFAVLAITYKQLIKLGFSSNVVPVWSRFSIVF
jgi:hypothetical protein